MLKRVYSFLSPVRASKYASFLYAFIMVMVAFVVWGYAFLLRRSDAANRSSVYESCLDCEKAENEILKLRHQLDHTDMNKAVMLSEEQVATAGKLLVIYDQWVGNCANGVRIDRYFDDLRMRVETTMAHPMADEVDTAEKTGTDAMNAGNYQMAIVCYTKSDKAQGLINDQYPFSQQADVIRKRSIERMLMEANYRPVIQPYLSMKTDADIAFDKADYETSRKCYSRLLREIDRLNAVVPQTYMNFDMTRHHAMQRLEESGARLKRAELDKFREMAASAVSAKNWKSAEESFSKAREIQRFISLNYPQTTFAKESCVKALDAEICDDLAKEFLYEFDGLLSDIGMAVKTGDAGRLAPLVTRAESRLKALIRKFPDSGAARCKTFEKLQFLVSHRYDLIDVRRAIASHIIKTAYDSDWWMLDREVWQLLYTRLMGGNPSARKADTLPVEGVTMEEARKFAEKLSWIMVDEVRIPEVDTYLKCMGHPDIDFLRKYAWTDLTAPNKETQPVATSKADSHGFFDLFGNAAEWAELSDANSSESVVIGGNSRDSPTRLLEIPQEKHPVADRVRNAGFRVIVRLSKQTVCARPR